MMKTKRIVLLCVLLFVLISSAIGCNKIDDSKKQEDNILGDYEVEIDSCYKEKHYYKGYVLVVKYRFTNNSDKVTSFFMAIRDKAYQEGVELNEDILWNTDVFTEIKPGATIGVEVGYQLRDTTTAVEVELTENSILADSDDIVSKTFHIENLA